MTTSEIKIGDKVRVAFKFDRLVVKNIRQFGSYRLIEAEFASGFGFYNGPESEFCKGWKFA